MINIRKYAALFIAMLLILTACPAIAGETGLEVHFIAIQRNDAILIVCDGEAAFIDGGPRYYGLQAVEYLRAQGIERLKFYIATHAHSDHIAGGAAVMAAFETEEVLMNYDLARQCIMSFTRTPEERAAAESALYTGFRVGETVYVGDAALTCVAPERIEPRKKWTDGAENDNSLVLRLVYGDVSFLLTGDTVNGELLLMMENDPESLRCTVFKNPHHNAKLKREIIEAVRPEYIVYSTAYDALPLPAQMNNARALGARVYITNGHHAGTTVFYSDGYGVEVQCENALTDWKLSFEHITLRPGKTKTAKASMRPGFMVNTLYWETSDEAIAVVDLCTGKITAISPGACVITATAFDGTQRQIQVTVQ